jgi:hypothetical protein
MARVETDYNQFRPDRTSLLGRFVQFTITGSAGSIVLLGARAAQEIISKYIGSNQFEPHDLLNREAIIRFVVLGSTGACLGALYDLRHPQTDEEFLFNGHETTRVNTPDGFKILE